jgi:hypothetical protein
VSGTGYSFAGPRGWTLARKPDSLELVRGIDVVSVLRFGVLHSYRPALWPEVVTELDRNAETIAHLLHGSVSSRETVTIAGVRARRYDVAFRRQGRSVVERLGFVLRGKTEYELLCRFERGSSTAACDQLFETFRLG